MKNPLNRLVSCVIAIFAISLIGCGNLQNRTVYFKDSSFRVEVARTAEEQSRGLMFRTHLDSDCGMLFIFKYEAPQPFHMKNTYIPLDIIWMDREKRVVFIKRYAKPDDGNYYDRISPGVDSMYVLELNAGTADRIGLKEGDILEWGQRPNLRK